MTRANVPVRAPRAVHEELKATARKQRLTLAEYLSRLATEQRLQALVDQAGLTGSTYINPRLEAAKRVQEVARRLGCRQWDAWLALHRLATAEG